MWCLRFLYSKKVRFAAFPHSILNELLDENSNFKLIYSMPERVEVKCNPAEFYTYVEGVFQKQERSDTLARRQHVL